MRRIPWVILGAAWLAGAGWSQTGAAGFFNPLSADQNGIHLYGVSVYGGYYSAGTPVGLDIPGASYSPSAAVINGTGVAGMGATFGWTKATDRATFSATYSPTYFGILENSEYNQLNHQFSLTATRKKGKWSMEFAAGGIVSNLEQLFFAPTALTSVASVPATFDDLAAAMLTGKMTDPQLASILTGAPLRSSPEQALFYGNRVFTANVQAGFNWARSERSSIRVALSGSRFQHLRRAGSADYSPQSVVLPQTTALNATVGWSYSLSPRTEFGAAVSTTRTFSRLQSGYANTSDLSFGRTMSRRWFVQMRGGAGKMVYSQHVFAASQNVQLVGGASLGFKTRAHTFLLSYDRTVGDIYGLGASTTSGTTGAWNWHAPGGGWSAGASYGYQVLSGSIFQNTKSWHGSASISRALGAHMFASVQYVYTTFPVNMQQAGNNFEQKGLMVALTWSPSPYR
jgi:hypothetical protein